MAIAVFAGYTPTQSRAVAMALFILFFLLALPIYAVISGQAPLGTDYRSADRSSAGIAPAPQTTPDAVIQVYAARALNWRGIFGVHTWIATKPENASEYTIHQVIGWRMYRKLPVVVSATGIPDGRWFGKIPDLICELRGDAAAAAIPKVLAAVEAYPYPNEYLLWPGPNSNTFMAYIGRHVPELRMDLPPNAIGKDYPVKGAFLDDTPSGTGYQLSIFGLLGVAVGREEGIELNVLGLNFGVGFFRPALKLPIVGRLGVPETRRPQQFADREGPPVESSERTTAGLR